MVEKTHSTNFYDTSPQIWSSLKHFTHACLKIFILFLPHTFTTLDIESESKHPSPNLYDILRPSNSNDFQRLPMDSNAKCLVDFSPFSRFSIFSPFSLSLAFSALGSLPDLARSTAEQLATLRAFFFFT